MKTQTGEYIKIQLGDKLKHREKVVGKLIKTDKGLVVLCNETKCTSISGILQAYTEIVSCNLTVEWIFLWKY